MRRLSDENLERLAYWVPQLLRFALVAAVVSYALYGVFLAFAWMMAGPRT